MPETKTKKEKKTFQHKSEISGETNNSNISIVVTGDNVAWATFAFDGYQNSPSTVYKNVLTIDDVQKFPERLNLPPKLYLMVKKMTFYSNGYNKQALVS